MSHIAMTPGRRRGAAAVAVLVGLGSVGAAVVLAPTADAAVTTNGTAAYSCRDSGTSSLGVKYTVTITQSLVTPSSVAAGSTFTVKNPITAAAFDQAGSQSITRQGETSLAASTTSNGVNSLTPANQLLLATTPNSIPAQSLGNALVAPFTLTGATSGDSAAIAGTPSTTGGSTVDLFFANNIQLNLVVNEVAGGTLPITVFCTNLTQGAGNPAVSVPITAAPPTSTTAPTTTTSTTTTTTVPPTTTTTVPPTTTTTTVPPTTTTTTVPPTTTTTTVPPTTTTTTVPPTTTTTTVPPTTTTTLPTTTVPPTTTPPASSKADLAIDVASPLRAAPGVATPVTVTVTNRGTAAAAAGNTGLFVGNGMTVTNAGGGTTFPVTGGTALGFATPALNPGASVTYTVTLTSAGTPPFAVFLGAATFSPTPDASLFNNLAVRFIGVF